MQLIVQSNLPNRKDLEINVNGPFTSKEFNEKVEPILEDPRWKMEFRSVDFLDPKKEVVYTLAERMASQINQFIQYSKFMLFSPAPFSGRGGGSALEDKIWVQTYNGSISQNSYEDEVNKVLTDIKRNAKFFEEQQKISEKEPVQTLNLREKWDGFGVHLFPPIIIGKKPKPTVNQLLYGNTAPFGLKEKIFDLEIDGRKIIVNKDGYIFVESQHKEEAIKIFNLIMSIGILQGIQFFAVREQDLSFVNYDKKTTTITSQQWHSQTIRSMLFDYNRPLDHYLGYQIKEINKDTLMKIIKDAFKILNNEKIVEDLRLFAEASTHFYNSEFPQSFIMSWSVIERNYSDLWKKMLDEKDMENERLSKLTNTAQWSIDYIIEALNLKEIIDDNDYDLLMELKRKRNRIYHSGKLVSKEDAERGINYVSVLLDDKIRPILS